MTNANTGSKYEMTNGMGIAAIAKLVRADIKTLLPAGFKVSIKSESFSMGRAIRVKVMAVPAGFQYWTDEYLAANPHAFFEGERLTAEARVLIRALERACAAYNYDRSDSMTDHFDVSFYATVSFDSEITMADRKARAA